MVLSGCSCFNKNHNKQQYLFKTENEIKELFTTFKFTITTIENESSVNMYDVMVNPDLMYYSNGINQYLIDKTSSLTYKVYPNNATKVLTYNSNVNETSVNQFYLSYLTAHYSINDGNFTKLADSVLVNEIVTDVYEEIENVQDKMITSERYYVDQTTGVCVKRSLSIQVGEIVSSTDWAISNLSFDQTIINQVLTEYNQFETKTESQQFDSWPNTPLANLVPKFTSGNFEIATDDGNECYIMIKNVVKRDVLLYVSQIKNGGFNEGKEFTNEFLQYFYVTYNADNILVSIKYSEQSLLFTMTIKKSNAEEIESELAKLQ